MSLSLWRNNGKMSLLKTKSVSQLVKTYQTRYPELDRDLLRKLIRLENKIENPSELKKLDRHLAKAFKNTQLREIEEKPSAKIILPNPMLNEKERVLFRLEVDRLAIEKQIAEGYSNDSEWAEWVKQKEDVFKQKWGISEG